MGRSQEQHSAPKRTEADFQVKCHVMVVRSGWPARRNLVLRLKIGSGELRMHVTLERPRCRRPALVPVGTAHDGTVTGDSLQAELRANFNDFLVLGAPDTTAKAACRTLLTTGILIGTKLVASKLTELDRWCGDAASRILAELILTHDRECRARTELAVVASGCSNCDMQDETPMAVKRRDAPLSENAPALVAAEEPSDAPSGGQVGQRPDGYGEQACGVADEAVTVEIVLQHVGEDAGRFLHHPRPADQHVATPRAHDWRMTGSCKGGKVNPDRSCGPFRRHGVGRCFGPHGLQLTIGVSALFQVGRTSTSSARTTSCTPPTKGRCSLVIPT